MFVIIPITRFGDFPEAAVSSLLPLVGEVQVLASFNRPIDQARDQRLLALLASCRASVIQTPRFLSPVAHFFFFVNHARHVLRIPVASPSVMVCDDDRLMLTPADILAISIKVRNGNAVWGPFSIERPGESTPAVHQAFFQPASRPVHSRLDRLSDEMAFERCGYRSEPAVFASITGLFVPFAALYNAAWFLKLTLSYHGARAEVLTLAFRNLSVSAYSTPVAAITFHNAQAGLAVRQLSHLRSEIRFRVYALVQCSSLRELWALMHLGFNPRWFWRAGVSSLFIAIRRHVR